MGGVVHDRVVGDERAAVLTEWVAGVGVDVESGKVARGYIEADAVALGEEVTGWV